MRQRQQYDKTAESSTPILYANDGATLMDNAKPKNNDPHNTATRQVHLVIYQTTLSGRGHTFDVSQLHNFISTFRGCVLEIW